MNGIAISGPDAGNYAANTTATASAEISAAGLTIAAVTDSRVYDGTVARLACRLVGAVFSGDTVTGVAQTFDTKHVGTGKTLSVTAYIVNDGNNGHNYMVAHWRDHHGRHHPAGTDGHRRHRQQQAVRWQHRRDAEPRAAALVGVIGRTRSL